LNASTGVLSGTPSSSGSSTFTITASDSNIAGLKGSQAYTLTVSTSSNPVRPQPTTLNTSSSQYQNLAAVFPLWTTSASANTVDYGPHGLTGSPNNIQIHTDPTMGNVFYANASTGPSGYKVPYNTYLDFGANNTAQAFSISCWINISISSSALSNANNPNNMYVVTFDANDGASYPGYGFGVAATLADNGPIVAEFDVDGHSAQASMFGKMVLNDGNWHLLVATYVPASSTARPTSTGNIYVDGALDTTSNSMAELQSPTVDPTSALRNPVAMYIGTDDDGKSSPWQGMFCDLRFYSGALTAAAPSQTTASETSPGNETALTEAIVDSPDTGAPPVASPSLPGQTTASQQPVASNDMMQLPSSLNRLSSSDEFDLLAILASKSPRRTLAPDIADSIALPPSQPGADIL
jgi:Concanavalin A-like lectin/glucanases superfamily/Putative Ig domain